MSDEPNGIPYWGREFARRLEIIERLEPAVIKAELGILAGEVRSLRRAFYTFAFGAVGSAIMFALSVFALIGRP